MSKNLTDFIDVGTMLDDTFVKYTDNFNKKTRRYGTNDRAIDRHLATMWDSMAECIATFTETETPSAAKHRAKENFDTARTTMDENTKAQASTLVTEVIAGILPAIAKMTADIVKSDDAKGLSPEDMEKLYTRVWDDFEAKVKKP